ncbi:hypothetical protein [Pseudonocardia alni]|uniref:Uncharacterized protein n=1 Tax=Pseudonocardia alni TaxID=33907 RepID=A0A852W333_PSEA5|nr:hypothetical protein [Pseudonocardia antarctica]NYG03129.1 hypothetical protein [Pseudonocardia antarctica]
MATWEDLKAYVVVRYEIVRQGADELRFRLPTTEDRDQLVVVKRAREGAGRPGVEVTDAAAVVADPDQEWVQIESPVARLGEVDLGRALELAGPSVVGGLAAEEGVVVFRHSIPLGPAALDGFEFPFRQVVHLADELEHALTGRDDH